MDLVDLFRFLDVQGEVMKSHLVDFERMAGELGICFPEIDRDAAQPGQNVNRQLLPIGILNNLTDLVAKELEERLEKLHRLAEVADRDGNVIDRSSQHPYPCGFSLARNDRGAEPAPARPECGTPVLFIESQGSHGRHGAGRQPWQSVFAHSAHAQHLAKVAQF